MSSVKSNDDGPLSTVDPPHQGVRHATDDASVHAARTWSEWTSQAGRPEGQTLTEACTESIDIVVIEHVLSGCSIVHLWIRLHPRLSRLNQLFTIQGMPSQAVLAMVIG